VLRTGAAAHKRSFTHDEVISLLAAAGHEGSFGQAVRRGDPPVGVWAPASDWKAFLIPDRWFCFGRISSDLGRYDLHPPFYFWLLHLWVMAGGVSLWTGPSLNIVIVAAATVFLFMLARRVLDDPLLAATVTLVWNVSPSLIATSLDARQYDLLALCTIVYTLLSLRYACAAERPGWSGFLQLALLTAVGMLTHYHFGLVVAGCIVFWVVVLSVRRDGRRAAAMLMSAIAGCILAALLHPGFYHSFLAQASRAEAAAAFPLSHRISKLLVSYIGFFVVHEEVFRYAVMKRGLVLVLLGVAFIAAVVVAYFRHRSTMHRDADSRDASRRFIPWLTLFLVGLTTVLYLGGVTPAHAMGGRYLSFAWPFFAFVPALTLRYLRTGRAFLALLLCLLMLWSGADHVRRLVASARRSPSLAEMVAGSDRVVLDNLRRGVVLQVVWDLPDSKLVLAADQTRLLRDAGRLGRAEGSWFYLSIRGYGNSTRDRDAILERILARGEVTLRAQGFEGLMDIFYVAERRGVPVVDDGGHQHGRRPRGRDFPPITLRLSHHPRSAPASQTSRQSFPWRWF